MKMKFTLAVLLLTGISVNAAPLFDKLCAFNPNWKKYEKFVPKEDVDNFSSDKTYIQEHLKNVLNMLGSADLTHLNTDQLNSRARLIKKLEQYRIQGLFPLNFHRGERIPVFIDELGTHCAVGFLMQESGYGYLAQQIAKEDNYIWVKDLVKPEVLAWQQQSGFSLEELKLIQGAYDSYMPDALFVHNRIEIPQKPEVATRYFESSDLAMTNSKVVGKAIWIRGEGENGVLNGKWEQNFSPTIPWIVGYYKNGKRTGRWMEYFRGTNKLCRTEHWENDKLNGVRTRFDEEGNVIERINFKDGKAILKTNFELGTKLMYLRTPKEDNTVYTEIYDMYGTLLARGNERIHNPGNLQWFQNIELTALNTMSLASEARSLNNANPNQVNYYNEPPLVEYIKENNWVYYADINENVPQLDERKSDAQLFSERFSHFGWTLYSSSMELGKQESIPDYDSIAVIYLNDQVIGFNGYFEGQVSRYRIERQINNYFTVNDYYSRSSYGSRGNQTYYFGNSSCGLVNENEEKIGKWYTYGPFNNQILKIEEFIVPEKMRLIQTQ